MISVPALNRSERERSERKIESDCNDYCIRIKTRKNLSTQWKSSVFSRWVPGECERGKMFDCAWNYHLNWKLLVHGRRRCRRKSASIPLCIIYSISTDSDTHTHTHITCRKAHTQTLKLICLKWCDSIGFHLIHPAPAIYLYLFYTTNIIILIVMSTNCYLSLPVIRLVNAHSIGMYLCMYEMTMKASTRTPHEHLYRQIYT